MHRLRNPITSAYNPPVKWGFEARMWRRKARNTFGNMIPIFRIAVCLATLVLACLGENPSGCKGPDSLEQAVRSSPSAGGYDALGAYFGQRGQFACALTAFQSAIRLEPNSGEAHFNLGLALLASGDARRAAAELRIAARLEPKRPESHVALGNALSQLNQSEAAINEFKLALQSNPKFVPALDGLTKQLIEQHRYSAAIAYLENAPPAEELQLNLAIANSRNGDMARATDILSLLVKEHPKSAPAHSNLGIAYTEQDRYREAASEFQKAIQLDPHADEDRISYLKALCVLAEFPTAEPVIDEYVERKPNDAEALNLKGVVYRGLGKYAEAEPVLSRAVVLNPASYDSHYNLGFVLAKLGKTKEAREQLEKALQLKPGSSEAQFQLVSVLRTLGEGEKANQELQSFEHQKEETVNQDIAGVKANQANELMRNGDVQRAVDLYREAISDDPKNARTYYNLALALDRLGEVGAERQALEQAATLNASLATVHNQLGFLNLQSGRDSEAEQQLKLAISLDAQYAEAQNNLGVLYGRQGKTKEAEQLFREATENNPQYAQAFVNLGLILASESRYSDADQALQSAIRLKPDDTKALTGQAMVLSRLGQQSDALELFRKIIALDPKSTEAHLNLGIALADQFKLEAALAEFSEAVRLTPDCSACHYNKGRLLLDLQRNGEAKPELDAAARLDPNFAECWYLLGLIEKEKGNTEESIKLFEKSLAADPKNPDALYKLGQGLLQTGDRAGAIARWRQVIAFNPDYGEALYNLSRILAKDDPEEAKPLQARFESLQKKEHIMDRAQTLGNFALASAAARDWPQAISQLKEALQVCGDCSALPQLHKDLGLIYCHSGDLKNGLSELQQAQRLTPQDPDVAQAIRIAQERR
jgi:tetratricopeptide (TPR) repeat protein